MGQKEVFDIGKIKRFFFCLQVNNLVDQLLAQSEEVVPYSQKIIRRQVYDDANVDEEEDLLLQGRALVGTSFNAGTGSGR